MAQAHDRPSRNTPPRLPGWVKVFGMLFLILVVAFVILHLTGNSLGGLHGARTPIELGVY